jgi:hypothetical protein
MIVTPLTEFIKFDVKTRVVTWETTNNLDAGIYNIKIFGSLKSFKNSVSFMLEVEQVQNSPVLLGLSNY